MSRIETALHGKDFRDDYLDLMATRFPAAAVERKRRAWDWLFAGPRGAERSAHVFAAERDGVLAGAFLMIPCRYVIDGREARAIHPVATVVRPDQTGAGPILMKAQLHFDGCIAIGVPNRLRLSKAYTRYEGMLSPARTLRRKVYRPGSVLAGRGRAPAGLSPVLDALAWAPVAAAGLRAATLRRDERVETIDAFGREFDDGWQAAAPSVAFAQTRDAAFLNWRYRDMPLTRHESFALRRGGRLAGYGVVAMQDAPGGRIGRITDIFAYAGGARDYGLLLAAADRRFRGAGCAIAEFSHAGGPALDAAARRAGFLWRKDMLPLVMRHDDPAVNARLPMLFERIHFCRGDHDEDY